MNPAFFYQVSGTMIRSKGVELNFIEVDEIYKDNNPIIARENAFNCYQNYIDVFLESKGSKYESHEETSILLQDFFNSYKKAQTKFGDEINEEIDVDYDKRLNIYMVMADSKIIINHEGEEIYEDKHLIHSINNQFTDYTTYIYDALRLELSLYEKYGYDYKNYKKDYVVSGVFEDHIIKSVLETPIDFTNIF
ncbi:MAG: hypothetical protein ACOYOV_10925 [Bacteroidales bacterium]